MTGGRTVDDDDVPLAAALELLDLAEHDDVVDARRGGGHDVDHAGRRQPAGDAPEAVLAQVGLERRRRRRSPRTATSPTSSAQHRLAVELDGEHAQAGVGGRSGEDCRYRGLADAPLARHDGDASGGQLRHRIDELRRHLCAD